MEKPGSPPAATAGLGKSGRNPLVPALQTLIDRVILGVGSLSRLMSGEGLKQTRGIKPPNSFLTALNIRLFLVLQIINLSYF